jgi:hypothetical protein
MPVVQLGSIEGSARPSRMRREYRYELKRNSAIKSNPTIGAITST